MLARKHHVVLVSICKGVEISTQLRLGTETQNVQTGGPKKNVAPLTCEGESYQIKMVKCGL